MAAGIACVPDIARDISYINLVLSKRGSPYKLKLTSMPFYPLQFQAVPSSCPRSMRRGRSESDGANVHIFDFYLVIISIEINFPPHFINIAD